MSSQKTSRGSIDHSITTLRTGFGSENIAHRFNINIYQESFAQYRSTLLYYERLDGLDIAALMNCVENPLDPTKVGQDSDMLDLFHRMETFVRRDLVIQESSTPSISRLISNYRNNGL